MLMIYESCKQVQQFDYDFEKSIYKKPLYRDFLKDIDCILFLKAGI